MKQDLDPESIRRVVIVGAGQAGAQACQSLRMGGFAGEIVLFGGEPVLPYQRPPLSKAYLKGELPGERLLLRPPEWYETQNITLRLGETVTGIDRQARTISTENGEESYDVLILATGSRPRPCRVPGADLPGVFDLRTLADIDAIRPLLGAGRKLVVIGGGYIGLEAAAVAKGLGLDVTVIERESRLLPRVAGEETGAFFRAAHERRGVRILTGTAVTGIEPKTGALVVQTEDGETIAGDIVLIGIGILPNEELAREAGLDCRNGITVDDDARTTDPFIFAIGDCSRRPLSPYARDGRLESVHNAIEQGKLAAAAILGTKRPPLDCPWFWSDQYDIKLQIAGLSSDYDQTVLRGDREAESFAVYYLRDGRLIAVDAVNSPLDFLASKKLILGGVKPDLDQLSDSGTNIKELASKWLAAQGA